MFDNCAEFLGDRHVNRNPKRVSDLSERAMHVLRAKLASDYHVYEFARQRLAAQHRHVSPLLDNTSPLPPPKGPKKGLSAWDRFQIELQY